MATTCDGGFLKYPSRARKSVQYSSTVDTVSQEDLATNPKCSSLLFHNPMNQENGIIRPSRNWNSPNLTALFIFSLSESETFTTKFHTFNMTLSIFFLSVLCSIALGQQYTAPGTLSNFHHVLERSKLQSPDPDTATVKPFSVADWFFYLQDGTYMQFGMYGEGRRTELRQMTTDGDEAAWSVTDSNTMTAEIALPTPEAAMQEFTFLQILCEVNSDTRKPALRIGWLRDYKGEGDAIFATVRFNAEDGDDSNVKRYYLAQRNSGTTSYEVKVDDSKITVRIGEDAVLPDIDASFWDPYQCNFKAGVYIQHQDDDSTVARTKFKELYWP